MVASVMIWVWAHTIVLALLELEVKRVPTVCIYFLAISEVYNHIYVFVYLWRSLTMAHDLTHLSPSGVGDRLSI